MTSSVVAGLLEKMTAGDKDFRYMATNDLMNELKKDTFRVDSQTEIKMVTNVLKLLEDNNGEVQNLVVKCLPLMVNTITEANLENVINKLCGHLSAGKEELRDIAGIGLKSVIVEIPSGSSVSPNLCKQLTPKLLQAIKAESASFEVKMDSLDLLTELLSRFGSLMTVYHQETLDALQISLAHQRAAIRKRTTSALGHLVKTLNDKLFASLVSHILGKIQGSNLDFTRSYLVSIAVISRYAGKRLSKHLEELSPVLLANLAKKDDELRESSLQTLEFLILQSQTEVAKLIPKTLETTLELIKYDPNYVDDGEGDENDMETDDAEEEEQSDGEYSDEDDLSWKVRRAASKTLAAIVLTRLELLDQLVKHAAPILISRFSEREENVRIENFNTFVILLRRIGAVAKQNRASDAMEASDGLVASLKELVPKISKALTKSVKDKSQKTKQSAFTILKELVLVLNGGLTGHVAPFSQPIATTLTNKSTSSGLKIEILLFTSALFKHHGVAAFSSLLNVLVPAIVKSASEKYYKVASEAFVTCSELIQTLRPVVPQVSAFPGDLVTYVQQIFAVTTSVLGIPDVDQEVKEKAIITLGFIIHHAGDSIQSDLNKSLSLLQDKINNEITRLVSVKTLSFVAKSPLNINLSSILSNVVNDLSTFLRKANRSLKLSSLIALNNLVLTRGKDIPEKQLNSIIGETKNLINDTDLQILPLVFTLLTNILKCNPACLPAVQSDTFPPIFQILRSPLLQGSSLRGLLELFGAIITTNPGLFDKLIQSLTEPINATGDQGLSLASSKQPFSSIAQSVAVVCQNATKNTAATVQKFITLSKKSNATDAEKYLGLLTLGEIGRRCDLGANDEVFQTVLSFFSDSSEEVKSASAYALGNISVGDLKKYVPLVLAEIKQQPKRQYLLLHSLKEIISQESQKDQAKNLIPFAEEIWTILFNNSENEEEGTRNAVAECLGKLTMINPQKYLPTLQANLKAASAFTRSTSVIAVRFTFATPSQQFNPLFKSFLENLVPLVKDSDLIVRRVSLQALNAAAHSKPAPVRELLPVILPILYEATFVQKDLIKIVTMGPFRYEVDEGLDYRKAAFECMFTLLNTCNDLIGIFDFMDRVAAGLSDKFDIRILSHTTLSLLCNLFPSAVNQKIEDFIGPLEATIKVKLKETAVKQEIEKNDELVKSALRAVASLSKVPEVETHARFAAFFKELKASEHNQKLEAIISEAESRDFVIERLDSMDTS